MPLSALLQMHPYGLSGAVTQALAAVLLVESGNQRDEALGLFAELPLVAFLIGARGERHATNAWCRLFGRTIPPWLHPSVEIAVQSDVMLHIPRVETDASDVCVAATVLPAWGARSGTALVVCADVVDSIAARAIAVPFQLSVWGGSLHPVITNYCNDPLRRYAGEQVGRPGTGAIHPADSEAFMRALDQALHDRVAPCFDMRIRRADGRFQWHAVTVVTTRDAKQWYALAVDCHASITLEHDHRELVNRLQHATQAVEQAHRIKDRAIALVSHELRTPVTTMLLWERILREPNASDAARAQALDAIHQSAALQSRVVGDLLDISRAISGKLYIDCRLVDVERLVVEAVEASLPAAHAKHIDITVDARPALGTLVGDAARLRQVLDNLLSNAIKFTEPGGRVNVTVRRKARMITIVVEDTGRGIDPTSLDRIFEPFHQGEALTSHRDGGLGLGLAIAKQIVELHDGTLSAYSDGPARGARMTVTLPTSGQQRLPSPPAGIAKIPSLANVRVLLIDDDDRVRSALTLLLRRAGAQVDRAESAAVARSLLAQSSPHVIVCDIAMPHEDGYTFINSMRASGMTIPAVALTAFAARADEERALVAGFDLHLAKPVDFERLVASLAQLVSMRDASR